MPTQGHLTDLSVSSAATRFALPVIERRYGGACVEAFDVRIGRVAEREFAIAVNVQQAAFHRVLRSFERDEAVDFFRALYCHSNVVEGRIATVGRLPVARAAAVEELDRLLIRTQPQCDADVVEQVLVIGAISYWKTATP